MCEYFTYMQLLNKHKMDLINSIMHICMTTDLRNQVEMVTTDASPDVIPTGKASTLIANIACIVNLHLFFC